MAEGQIEAKNTKAPKSVDDEITALKEKLKKLEERKKEDERKKRERNAKAVLDILRDEKLDLISSDVWRNSLPQLRKLLGQELQSETETVKT